MNVKKSVFLFLFLVAGISQSQAQEKKFKIHTVAFYNVENLFDTINYNYHENYSVNPITPRNFYMTLTYKL